ncbi:MAG: diaminopimelate epimerase, partial [Syntrophales bacterium]
MIEFTKMSGSGNDFILIDNIGGALKIDDLPAFARRVCKRKVSVGADGLILIEKSDRADFRWQFFNADGSRAEMCGNGGRCAARFAFVREITGPRMSFETGAGIVDAEVKGTVVKLRLT